MALVLWKVFVKIAGFLKGLRHNPGFSQLTVSSILLIELTRLGDVLSMLPAVRLIRVSFPFASISVIVDARYLPLLRALDLGVGVEGVENSASLPGFLRAIVLARHIRAELALSMSPSKRNAGLAIASGAIASVGYLTYVNSRVQYLTSTPVDALGCRLSHREEYGREHIGERALKVCRAIGIRVTNGAEGSSLREDHHLSQRARQRLSEQGLIPSRKFVVIHPLSGWEFKTWSMENFQRLTELVVNELAHDVVFIYATEESEHLVSVRTFFEGNTAVHFFPSANLVETACLMSRASLAVGNDSGPLHLAAQLGVRPIGLFGPAPPQLTAPRTESLVSIYKELECSPCDQITCVRPNEPCMKLISVDEVFSEVRKALTGSPAAECSVPHA